MTTWLTKQRKGDLQQLAVAAEIPGYGVKLERMRKNRMLTARAQVR